MSPSPDPFQTPDSIPASAFQQLLINAGNHPPADPLPSHTQQQGTANEYAAGRQQPNTEMASRTELCSSSGSVLPGSIEDVVAPATQSLVSYPCDDSVQSRGVGTSAAWENAAVRGEAGGAGFEPCGLDIAAFLPPSLSPRQARKTQNNIPVKANSKKITDHVFQETCVFVAVCVCNHQLAC